MHVLRPVMMALEHSGTQKRKMEVLQDVATKVRLLAHAPRRAAAEPLLHACASSVRTCPM
jgi:hypothetical protein